ncbi:MAG: nitrate reductase cytochrome c-type subunit; periplasmic nitrate reductase electron transfer subunit [Betaproteobacteria bacterium]|nr:nitrate reductase cytochrome c-type subunit; periplasmic nitrate reductase electron transfer subunit [Betaproteobacteria bacterium]
MKRSVTIGLAAVLAAVLYGCAQYGGVAALRGSDTAAADQAPAAHFVYMGKKPGLQKPIDRTIKGQPPLVPHAVDNFDEITVAENQCMDCHSIEKYREKQAPKLGDSHLAFSKDGMKKTLLMDRYQCNTCHVPQVDAKPLVETNFVGSIQK